MQKLLLIALLIVGCDKETTAPEPDNICIIETNSSFMQQHFDCYTVADSNICGNIPLYDNQSLYNYYEDTNEHDYTCEHFCEEHSGVECVVKP